MTQMHQYFPYEQRRVDHIREEIKQKELKIAAKTSDLKQDVIELRKTFWDDVTVNLDEPDDVIETEASIKQQAELLTQKETIHGSLAKELKTLNKLKDTPYFGRIDFTEDGEEKEAIYIGIASLMDSAEENFLIYDWRAPISSLYYDYALGSASYQTLDGEISGEISLKRQFIIRNGVIKAMFDTGLTIGDQLLQEALGNNASTTMKSIVATIQKEQNKIIRNEKSKLLVVQGVAGSGKTSAALQRIAYLMYRYRMQLNPENVMLFSPNPLFSSYIRNVLPELGEENVRQTTFYYFVEEKAGEDFSIESPFSQMEYMLTNKRTADSQIRMQGIACKSSLVFKEMIDNYIASLYISGVCFKPVVFRNQIIISNEAIANYFYSLDSSVSLFNRMELVTNWLLKELAFIQKQEVSKDWVEEKIELLDKEAYAKAYHKAQKQTASNVVDEEMILRKAVVGKMFVRIKKRIKQYAYVDVPKTFTQLFKCQEQQKNLPAEWNDIAAQTIKSMQSNILRWEDAAPYAYFKGKLLGDMADRSVRYLVIDEAQDFSAFQFAYIKELFPHTRMTLLGDVNQAIYNPISKQNSLLLDEKNDVERITLTKSYRPTKQLVQFTRHFAPEKDVIEPFEREGNKPKLVAIKEENQLVKVLMKEVQELLQKGYQTIALVTKSMHESKQLYRTLKGRIDCILVDEETYTFTKGILIIPVYLAKGIEFDAVVIPDATNKHYTKEDQILFYTACTRAMHDLSIMVIGEPTAFIKETPKNTYQMTEI
ncbi:MULTISPECIES: RNA polymerase recycling motor HelD [Clostridia]|uniref:RNA polymerase recycling motor HelD n=1 Tax=Clostridia TaxID=186801 RepID=UPI000EA12ABC|nr:MULTISPECIES: RNA polymerase recycling motor HelD [Clostridia]NBJ67941.1 helicase [Roseburia sp. 1XD42-34]RKI82388.1 helicase [Clostridium sp. 1xD42-85]